MERAELIIPNHILNELIAETPNPARLAKLIALHLEFLIDSRGTSVPRIGEAPLFIAAIRKHISQLEEIKHEWLRIEHELLRAEIQLSAHGIILDETHKDVLARYSIFSKKHAEVLHNSLFSWVSCKIEDDLYIAQEEMFNTFRFEEVAALLAKDISMYQQIIGVIKNFDLEDFFNKDILYAKLSGTLGQAFGFLACIAKSSEQKDRFYKQAADYLSKDIQCLQRGDKDWIQGVNFLSTLEWRKGNFEAALRWLMEALLLTQHPGVEDLSRISGANALVRDSHSQYLWILLNQVRILALAVKREKIKIDSETAVGWLDDFLEWPDAIYPRNLIIKWLLVIADSSGSIPSKILTRAQVLLLPDRKIPVLELMRAVEICLLSDLEIDSAVSEEMKQTAKFILANLLSGGNFEAFLSNSSWAVSLLSNHAFKMNDYETAMALPYYFA